MQRALIHPSNTKIQGAAVIQGACMQSTKDASPSLNGCNPWWRHSCWPAVWLFQLALATRPDMFVQHTDCIPKCVSELVQPCLKYWDVQRALQGRTKRPTQSIQNYSITSNAITKDSEIPAYGVFLLCFWTNWERNSRRIWQSHLCANDSLHTKQQNRTDFLGYWQT